MSDEWTDAGFAGLLPKTWFARPEDSSALVFCYQMMLAARPELVPPVVTVLDRVCAIFFFGSVTYFDPGHPKLLIGGAGFEVKVEPKSSITNEGAHLLLVTPLRVDGVDGAENDAAQRIQVAAALISGVLGHDATYDLVFENTFALSGKTMSASTPAFENPYFWPKPDPAKMKQVLEDASRVIGELSGTDRSRVELSLRLDPPSVERERCRRPVALLDRTRDAGDA